MFALICFVFAILVSPFRSKIRLEAENMALRHQLMVLRRQVRGRVRVCTENSNSDIMVMQSAKDRVGMDTSSSLNWARERRVLI